MGPADPSAQGDSQRVHLRVLDPGFDTARDVIVSALYRQERSLGEIGPANRCMGSGKPCVQPRRRRSATPAGQRFRVVFFPTRLQAHGRRPGSVGDLQAEKREVVRWTVLQQIDKQSLNELVDG
jgi:hypothetical protein